MAYRFHQSRRFLGSTIEAVERAFQASTPSDRELSVLMLSRIDDPGGRVEALLGDLEGWLKSLAEPPPYRNESPRKLAQLPHMSAEQISKMTGLSLNDCRRLLDDPKFVPPAPPPAKEPEPITTLDKPIAERLMALLSQAEEAKADAKDTVIDREQAEREALAHDQEQSRRLMAATGGIATA
jgi:DNA-binding transcriptional MerR regulator